jgi:hypothetical protein
MISEVSVHGHLALLLWAGGKADHYGREHTVEQRYSPRGGQEAEREEVRDWGPNIPSRACPAPPYFLPVGPTS